MTVSTDTHTSAGVAVTDLILETFRFNGRLLAAGDRLTADQGLTSARWQVLGAIQDAPASVAQIARDMGLTRQAVQRLANELAADGFVAFADNPQHRRAKLVRLTETGTKSLRTVMRRQTAWSNQLAEGIAAKDLHKALAVIRTLRGRLDADPS